MADLTYRPLPGSARRYRMLATGEVISYRQFLKRVKGIHIERRAAERKAQGLTPPRQPRKDKGHSKGKVVQHLPAKKPKRGYWDAPTYTSARQRRLLTPLDIPISIEVVSATISRVISYYQPIGEYENLGHGAKKFLCRTCGLRLREEHAMQHHLYYHHSSLVGNAAAAPVTVNSGGRVEYTGNVPSRSRKARMPWRTEASGK